MRMSKQEDTFNKLRRSDFELLDQEWDIIFKGNFYKWKARQEQYHLPDWVTDIALKIGSIPQEISLCKKHHWKWSDWIEESAIRAGYYEQQSKQSLEATDRANN